MSQQQQKPLQPPQQQSQQPGIESQMTPLPRAEDHSYQGSGKLRDKVAIITGGDSGIGRAVAIMFAKEGAQVVISYLNEHKDAEETRRQVEQEGRRCLLIAGDIGDAAHCRQIVEQTIRELGRLDILVNNAAEQHPQEHISDISQEQLERTFRTNIFSYFFMVQAAIPHLTAGSAIINTTSVTAYRGSPKLLDYSSTKGAIVAFTRSLALALADQKIRVMVLRRGQSGLRSFRPPSHRIKSLPLVRTCRSVVPDSPKRSHRVLSFWLRTIRPTCPGRFCTRMAAKSLTVESLTYRPPPKTTFVRCHDV